MKILLVEDDPRDVQQFRTRLEEASAPFELFHVRRVEDADRIFDSERIDVVFLDLSLPGHAGHDALAGLQAAAPHVPMIALASGNDESAALQALRRGAQDYLVKGEAEGHLIVRSIRYAIERKRLQERERFLAEASRLLASSLDYEQTLTSIARLSVESLSDYCIIDIDEGDEIRRLQVAQSDAAHQSLAQELLHYPLDRRRPHLAWSVRKSREALLIPEVTRETLESMAQGSEHLRLLRAIDPRSMIAVPLVARGRILGSILFLCTSRAYDREDLALAQRLAHVAAIEVDNARLYRDARNALHQRDRVLGVVAHDLRNPLHAITLGAELISETPLAEEQVGHVQLIQRSAERMSRLIHDLLDVSRIESGQLSLHPEPWDAALLVREALDLNAALAAKKGVKLRLRKSRDLPPVVADRDRILQVFANLIGNAVKFTPSGGGIDLSVKEMDGEICFAVADSGCGIAREHLPDVFRPFWQARRGGVHGAGLGLAIAKGIVDAHGGRIWVESTVGQGSTFYFSLPAGGPPEPGAGRRGPAGSRKRLRRSPPGEAHES